MLAQTAFSISCRAGTPSQGRLAKSGTAPAKEDPGIRPLQAPGRSAFSTQQGKSSREFHFECHGFGKMGKLRQSLETLGHLKRRPTPIARASSQAAAKSSEHRKNGFRRLKLSSPIPRVAWNGSAKVIFQATARLAHARRDSARIPLFETSLRSSRCTVTSLESDSPALASRFARRVVSGVASSRRRSSALAPVVAVPDQLDSRV